MNSVKKNVSNEIFQLQIAMQIKGMIIDKDSLRKKTLLMAILYNFNTPYLDTRINKHFKQLNQNFNQACKSIAKTFVLNKLSSNEVVILCMLCYCLNAISHHNIITIRRELESINRSSQPINIPSPFRKTKPDNYIQLLQPNYIFEHKTKLSRFLSFVCKKSTTYTQLIDLSFFQLSNSHHYNYLDTLQSEYNEALTCLKNTYEKSNTCIAPEFIMALGYCSITLRHPIIQRHREQLDRITENQNTLKQLNPAILH